MGLVGFIFFEGCAAVRTDRGIEVDLLLTFSADEDKFGAAGRAGHLTGGQGRATRRAQVSTADGTTVNARLYRAVTVGTIHRTCSVRVCVRFFVSSNVLLLQLSGASAARGLT